MTNVIAENTQQVATSIWKGGLYRVARHFPTWSVDQPEFHDTAVVFIVRNHERAVRVQVESIETERRPLALRGPNYQVSVLDDAGEPEVALAFARAIVTIDRSGRALRMPSPQSKEKNGEAAWRELFIADACNLKCAFCCESVRIGRGSLMAWAQIEATLHRYARDGVRVVQFMGGEPTIHPRFPDALRLSRALGMRNYAITNLLQWSKPGFAEAVGPLLDELMISMHAFGAQTGAAVTGRKMWWSRFLTAADNARQTLTARIYGATVLTRHNVDDLEKIAAVLVSLGVRKWVMGNSVPIAEAPKTSLDLNLTLAQQRDLMGRFRALRAWTAARGCELVFFCMPDCVLAPDLWPASHDRMLHDQDLSGALPDDEVTFWSRTDFQDEAVRNVSLGRRFDKKCDGCVRKTTCGGYFGEYLDAVGGGELQPLAHLPDVSPSTPVRPSAVLLLQRSLRVERHFAAPELTEGAVVFPIQTDGERVGAIRISPAGQHVEGTAPDRLSMVLDEVRSLGPMAWPTREPDTPMLLLTSGVPRSGTSWLARCVDTLVRSTGAHPRPGRDQGERRDDFPINAPNDAAFHRLRAFLRQYCAAPDGLRCAKTHFIVGNADTDHPAVRVLYIYRDPRDVLTSTYFYALAGPAAGHFAGRAPEDVFEELLVRVVPMLRTSLKRAAMDALPTNTFLVRYRDLLQQPVTELNALAEHVGVSLPPGFAEALARRHGFAREAGRPAGQEDRRAYHRAGRTGDWTHALPEALREMVQLALPDADALIEAVDAQRRARRG